MRSCQYAEWPLAQEESRRDSADRAVPTATPNCQASALHIAVRLPATASEAKGQQLRSRAESSAFSADVLCFAIQPLTQFRLVAQPSPRGARRATNVHYCKVQL